MYLVRMAANFLGMHQFDVMDSPSFMAEAIKYLQERNIYIIDDQYKWADIQRTAREIKATIGLDVMVLDYMHNVRRTGQRIYERMSELAAGASEYCRKNWSARSWR